MKPDEIQRQIEDQNRRLREAFAAIEGKQIPREVALEIMAAMEALSMPSIGRRPNSRVPSGVRV